MVNTLLAGLHSQIPLCCILSFIADEERGVEEIAQSKNALYGPEWVENFQFQYVPCRACWNRFLATGIGGVKIHRCGPECFDGDTLSDEGWQRVLRWTRKRLR